MLIINAYNINVGGGGLLLKELILGIKDPDQTFLFVDKRFAISNRRALKNFTYKEIYPTFFGRFFGEILLYMKANKTDHVICFGNLPPIFRSKARVFLFLQNRLLIDKYSLASFPLKTKWRIFFERFLFKFNIKHVDEVIVQTTGMRNLLKATRLGFKKDSIVLPFMSSKFINQEYTAQPKKYDFIYPSSPDPHKNHKTLIAAWIVLAKDHLFPSLVLTLDPKNNQSITKAIKDYSLNIKMVNNISHKKLLSIYLNSKALIFPSKCESLGLPLLEAQALNIPIIASELDFVWDVVNPQITFDPNSAQSIARAVKRYLNVNTEIAKPIDSAKFISLIKKYKDKCPN
jgi:glycosyltransferase involved in cell wall biosynthesis